MADSVLQCPSCHQVVEMPCQMRHLFWTATHLQCPACGATHGASRFAVDPELAAAVWPEHAAAAVA